MIWGTIAVNGEGATAYAASSGEMGLDTFLKVTICNVVMAYFYVCAHVCAFPIGVCIAARNPERFVANLRPAHELDDDDLDLLGDVELAE